jgi:flagellar biosynthesis/type III secretory pathway M-ring protein FliF/YscJ
MTGTVVSTETSLRPYQEALNAQKQKNPYITVATKQNEAIVGIVVAMVCVALVAGIVIHKVRRRRRLLQAGKSNTPSSSKSGTNTNTDGTEVVEEMELELAVANKTID